jgi:hypothetical protein
MQNLKLLETLANIAYIAGYKRYYSGTYQDDINEYISWAEEFEFIHKNTNWKKQNYRLEIEQFTKEKFYQLS